MTRRKTDGERIVATRRKWVSDEAMWLDAARRIDRIIRKRMAEAWYLGRTYGINDIASDANPYRGRAKP